MVVILILLAAASRLLPHPPNFTPVAALGVFGGAMLGRRAAWFVPVGALFASDLVLGFYLPVIMFWNYLGLLACVGLGSGLLRARRGPVRIAGGAIASSLVFFALSNFGMWASGYYPRTAAGLGRTYAMGLPFLGNTFASDVLFTAALFGGHALLARLAARLQARPSAA